MTNTTCADEHKQKWMRALRQEMGMPQGGSAADAVRWFAIGVPDEPLSVQLSRLAIESRVDLVAAVFRYERDLEPTGFAAVFRTIAGAEFGGCLPVAFGKDAPLALYAPKAQCLYQLDERGVLARRDGERVNGLQLAHKRAMKRLRRAVAAIDLNDGGPKWQEVRSSDPSIPGARVRNIVVKAA